MDIDVAFCILLALGRVVHLFIHSFGSFEFHSVCYFSVWHPYYSHCERHVSDFQCLNSIICSPCQRIPFQIVTKREKESGAIFFDIFHVCLHQIRSRQHQIRLFLFYSRCFLVNRRQKTPKLKSKN